MSVASTRKSRYVVEPLPVDTAEAAALQAGMPALQSINTVAAVNS